MDIQQEKMMIFYRAEFGTPAPRPNYQKPITPTPNNPQPIKEDNPSDKIEKPEQRNPTQNKFDNLLNGEDTGGGNSGGENDSK